MKRLLMIIMIAIMLLSLAACTPEKVPTLRAEDIKAVCELATLKCYYNNVAKIIKKPDNIFQVEREMWIEYEGLVTVGIDMLDMEIDIDGDVITITMPPAKMLSSNIERMDENSYVSSADGWFIKNEITTEEQNAAVTRTQKEMEAALNENGNLFKRAERKAKELIENYITKLSEAIDREYTIVWKQQEA